MLLISCGEQAYFQWLHKWYQIPRNHQITWVITPEGNLFKVEWYDGDLPDLAKIAVSAYNSRNIMTDANYAKASHTEDLEIAQIIMWRGTKFSVHVSNTC